MKILTYQFLVTINDQGHLELTNEQLQQLPRNVKARVTISIDNETLEPEDLGFSAESFDLSWQQALNDETLPVSQLWQGFDDE